MEFLRFGSSIPGGYWGCCAVCIIQNFKYEPDAKASIELVSGDGGYPMTDNDGNQQFAGPTYRDIFQQRLRIGTFSNTDMPNHTFFAVLTEGQIGGKVGKAWLEILKESGFEFVRTVDNSVYTGDQIAKAFKHECSSHKNYIFALYRNIGRGLVEDPFTPPKAWTDLSDPYSGDMSPKNVFDVQKALWEKNGPTKLLTEAEVVAAGAPVILAGRRKEGAAPEEKSAREARESKTPKKAPASNPAFG